MRAMIYYFPFFFEPFPVWVLWPLPFLFFSFLLALVADDFLACGLLLGFLEEDACTKFRPDKLVCSEEFISISLRQGIIHTFLPLGTKSNFLRRLLKHVSISNWMLVLGFSSLSTAILFLACSAIKGHPYSAILNGH